jgi:hypothetical protein
VLAYRYLIGIPTDDKKKMLTLQHTTAQHSFVPVWNYWKPLYIYFCGYNKKAI